MMEINVPYGHSFLVASIPDRFPVDRIEPPGAFPLPDPVHAVHSALVNLLGGVAWTDFRGVRSVAIAINDKTRPVPHRHLLHPLLERLSDLGIQKRCISFYVAVGMHPAMNAKEYPTILPDGILEHYRIISHDSKNEDSLVYLGTTSRNTPVWCNKDFAQSELKIVVGDIEPHQFAGFSGGVKSAAIGLAGAKTINANHALLTHPDSRIGEYETNPARQDIEEIGQKIGIHLALNAILNPSREIVHVLAGDPRFVIQAGIPLSRQFCQVGVPAEYDLIISSPGGHPKDIDLYQSQKGLAHAALIMKAGGTVILTAACPEGSGNLLYEIWTRGKRSHAEVLQAFSREGFRIGPHKAYQIARDASRFRLLFCSDMDSGLSRSLLLDPVPDLQTAIDQTTTGLSHGARIGILPHASSTIPYLLGSH